jgi:hypothetical protein
MGHNRKPLDARERMTDLSFKICHEDREALAALAEVTKAPQAEVIRTGVKIMLERARQAGLIPREPGPKAQHSAPTEMATPTLRAV